jgi:hypothetical protein
MPSIVSSLMPQHPAQAVIASCDETRQGRKAVQPKVIEIKEKFTGVNAIPEV